MRLPLPFRTGLAIAVSTCHAAGILIASDSFARDCDEVVAAAAELCAERRFDTAVRALNPCLRKGEIPLEARAEAFRLLALAYTELEQLDQARGAIRRLLVLEPDWMPDTDGATESFLSVAEEVRHDPFESRKRAVTGAASRKLLQVSAFDFSAGHVRVDGDIGKIFAKGGPSVSFGLFSGPDRHTLIGGRLHWGVYSGRPTQLIDEEGVIRTVDYTDKANVFAFDVGFRFAVIQADYDTPLTLYFGGFVGVQALVWDYAPSFNTFFGAKDDGIGILSLSPEVGIEVPIGHSLGIRGGGGYSFNRLNDLSYKEWKFHLTDGNSGFFQIGLTLYR